MLSCVVGTSLARRLGLGDERIGHVMYATLLLHLGCTGYAQRPADGGAHTYYNVGIEHLAFEVESRDDVDAAHERCLARGARIH